MPTPFRARPLALAGPAAVVGVLLQAAGSCWWMLAPAPMVFLGLRRHLPAALLVAAALLAGYASARRARLGTPRAWPRAPPRLGTCDLTVEDCREDPFRHRAWLTGRRGDGVGVLCSWPGTVPAGVGRGACVRVSGRLRVPRTPGNPGEADQRERLALRGIALLVDLRDAANLELRKPAPRGLRQLLALARRNAARRFVALLPADVAPLATALLLGIRTGIEPMDRLRFERTGTAHVLAISGMHVVLLAGMVHALLRLFGAGPRLAAGITLLLALLYVPVAGGAPPIRRAVTVLVCYGLALVRGRPADVASALGGAALLIAVREPADVLRLGFRLSFAAAAGIALLAGAWSERWGRRHRLLARFPAVREDRRFRLLLHAYLLRAFPVSLAAWCATQGLIALEFGVVTPLAPFLNVAIAPLVALILPLLAMLAMGWDAAAGPVAWSVQALRGILDAAQDLPFVQAAVCAPPPVVLLIWCGGVVLLAVRPRAGVAAMVAAAALGAAAPATFAPRDRDATLMLFDVGHGQAALVRFDDGAAALVDAGSRGRRTLARRTLAPALHAVGVRRLEAIVCTHGDADHWSAAPELLGLLPVGRIVVGRSVPAALALAARRRGVPVVHARAGDLVYGTRESSLRVLAEGPDGAGSNDGSLVLLLEARGRRVLMPADREEEGLRRLLEDRPPPCDVLVAPHHGASCALAREVAEAVKPRWLLVSANEGYPDPPTLDRYAAGRRYVTWRDGCVTVRVSARGRLRVNAFRR